MSAFDVVVGPIPYAPHFAAMLDLQTPGSPDRPWPTPRLRDVYCRPAKADEDAKGAGWVIVAFLRVGGGNRADYQPQIDLLRTHPRYLRDFDDPYDSTYAHFEFACPDEHRTEAGLFWHGLPERDRKLPLERFNDVLDGMKRNDLSDPRVVAAYERGKSVVDKLRQAMDAGGGTVIEI